MTRPPAFFRALAISFALISLSLASKRPLTHADYDSWKKISAITLSRDGHYLAYLERVPRNEIINKHRASRDHRA